MQKLRSRVFGSIEGLFENFHTIAVFLVVFSLVMAPVLGSVGLALMPKPAYANHVTCLGYYHSAYTGYYNGKPTLFVYNGKSPTNPPKAYSFHITYKLASGIWEVVRNDDWGVNVNYPQTPHSGANGWHYYYIATRWYSWHPDWDNDSNWRVWACD